MNVFPSIQCLLTIHPVSYWILPISDGFVLPFSDWSILPVPNYIGLVLRDSQYGTDEGEDEDGHFHLGAEKNKLPKLRNNKPSIVSDLTLPVMILKL